MEEKIIVDRGQFENQILMCGYCWITKKRVIRSLGGRHELSHHTLFERIKIEINTFWVWRIKRLIRSLFK